MDAIKKFSSMEMVKEISSIIRVYALGNVYFEKMTNSLVFFRSNLLRMMNGISFLGMLSDITLGRKEGEKET